MVHWNSFSEKRKAAIDVLMLITSKRATCVYIHAILSIADIYLTFYESRKLRYFNYKYGYFDILRRNFSKLKPVINVLMLVSLKHAADV